MDRMFVVSRAVAHDEYVARRDEPDRTHRLAKWSIDLLPSPHLTCTRHSDRYGSAIEHKHRLKGRAMEQAMAQENGKAKRVNIARGTLLMAAGVSVIGWLVNEPATLGAADALASFTAPQQAVQPAFAYRWTPQMTQELVAEIAAAGGEGLDPARYGVEAIRAELDRTGGSAELDRLASAAALSLAHDYWLGRIDDRAAFDWHIERTDADMSRLAMLLAQAEASGQVRPWLRTLLPSDARYEALRAAYAATPAEDRVGRDRLRANLERWRWMPRDLGADHIYVNVPSYTLAVVEDGKAVSSYTVVVGARATPTPQIGVPAQSVVVNPWWNVPTSIIRSSNLRPGAVNPAKGYVFQASGSGYIVRQRPGPGNALGRVKIDMPNAHSIYLHDTPAKSYFEKTSRAYSHGCIRVKNIDRLAAELVQLDSGSSKAVVQGLAGSQTATVKLQHSRPVWLVYFTADVGADGKVAALEDPYSRDARLVQRLDAPVRLASAG